jgi:beta-lactamase regulating signal transducer with metallopeptidase domain
VGLGRPVVLVPEAGTTWSAARKRVVLLHELSHVKRHDCASQLVAHVACAVYWFNPLVWCAARALRVERERVCDEAVVRDGTPASSYADHLL